MMIFREERSINSYTWSVLAETIHISLWKLIWLSLGDHVLNFMTHVALVFVGGAFS